jgi:hypothetical protein
VLRKPRRQSSLMPNGSWPRQRNRWCTLAFAWRRRWKRYVSSSAPAGCGECSVILAQHVIACAADVIGMRLEVLDTGHLIVLDEAFDQALGPVLMWINQSAAAATLDLQQVARSARPSPSSLPSRSRFIASRCSDAMAQVGAKRPARWHIKLTRRHENERNQINESCA